MLNPRFLILFALLALSGCASGLEPVGIAQRQQLNTIALVPRLGDTLTWQHVGLIVFQNETARPKGNWNLDESVTQAIETNLSSKYQLQRFTGLDSPPDGNESMQDVIEKLRKVGAGNVDAYLVITQGGWGDQIGNTNQVLHGLGVYSRSGAFSGSPSLVAVYAVFDMTLVDGHTFKILGKGFGMLPSSGGSIGDAINGYRLPYEELPLSAWSKSYDVLPPDRAKTLREAMERVIKQSTPLGLQRMKLID